MRTQDANEIHIIDYLTKIGLKPVRQQRGTNGLEYVYRCPLRKDSDPSLCVNYSKNIWSDRPTAQGGRILDLVCYLNNLPKDSIKRALAILDSLFSGVNFKNNKTAPFNASVKGGSFSKNQNQIFPQNNKTIEIVKVQELFSFPLKNYLSLERFINLELAKPYIKEIRYKPSSGKVFYAVGFKSGEAFSLRSKFFKGFAGTGIDISIFEKKSSTVNLFEG